MGSPEPFIPTLAPNISTGSVNKAVDTTVVNRLELLQSKPDVIGRFMRLTVPVLVDVYAASVLTNVRVRSMAGILKVVHFLDGAELERTLQVSPIYLNDCDLLTKISVCPLPPSSLLS
jgi:hypothetical protein